MLSHMVVHCNLITNFDCHLVVVLFDDWGHSVKNGKRGQKEAFEEVVVANPAIRFITLPAYREEARAFLLTRV